MSKVDKKNFPYFCERILIEVPKGEIVDLLFDTFVEAWSFQGYWHQYARDPEHQLARSCKLTVKGGLVIAERDRKWVKRA